MLGFVISTSFDRYKAPKYIAHLYFRRTTFNGFRSFPQCYFYKYRIGVYRGRKLHINTKREDYRLKVPVANEN